MTQIALVIAAILAVLVLVFFGLNSCDKKTEPPAPAVKVYSVDIASFSQKERELSTLTYEYTAFGTYSKDNEQLSLPFGNSIDIPYTGDEIFFTYGGTIKVGFHLDEVTPELDKANKKINITIPEPEILSHTPNHDVEQTYVVKNHVLMSSTEERINAVDEAKATARDEKEKDVMNNETTKQEAIEEFKDYCNDWLLTADPNHVYTIVFHDVNEESTSENDN